jgi:tripartite-type tricarboxylate transporter receptor subunit TctC
VTCGIKNLGFVIVALASVVFAAGADAAPYPEKPVRLICPFPPGGAADMVSRLLAEKMTASLGRQVIVDNRTGAGGNIGVELAAKAAPDGYTILLASSSNFSFAPSLGAKLPYDPQRDFSPIALAVMVPNLLTANISVPARNIGELIQLAKASPGKITFASPGMGTTSHIIGELFAHSAGIKLLHVPFSGGGPASVALLGGHVQLLFGSVSTSLPNIRAGKLRGLGVTSARRSDAAPDIPTIAESGLPGFEVVQWFGLAAGSAIPKPIVGRLNMEVVKATAAQDVREKLLRQGLDAAPANSPQQFSTYIADEVKRLTRFFKESGLKLE